MRILHIQHAGALGGSCASLLYTAEGLRARGHDCVVALARPARELVKLYQEAGFEVVSWPLRCWDHSTVAPRPLWNPLSWVELARVRRDWRSTGQRTLALVRETKPDVVHLNSMPLSPSAAALAAEGVPFVWHVREPPPDQSWRTRTIRSILRRAPARIFISRYDRESWMAGPDGVVIHNFVDARFFEARVERAAVRRELAIPDRAFVLLYLGGAAGVKGGHLLLDALAAARIRVPELVAIMPCTEWQPARTALGRIARGVLPLLGSGLPIQTFSARVERHGLEPNVRRLGFEPKVERLIAASDLLVFPATAPHFARPVIEAAAMGCPAIGSDIGGVNELIIDGVTGVLVRPVEPQAFAKVIIDLASRPERVRDMGQAARRHAQLHFEARRQTGLIEEQLLSVVRAPAPTR